jgi:hypothetical protein
MRKCLVLGVALLFLTSAWADAENARGGGTLKVGTLGMVLKVKMDPSSKYATKKVDVPVPANKDFNLPAGKYDVAGVELYAQDKQKQVWGLESAGNLGSLKTFDITEGQTTTVEGGGPLTLKITATVANGPAAKAPIVPVAPVRAGAGCANAPVAGQAPPAGANPPAATGKVVNVIVRYVGKSGEEYGPKLTVGNRPMTPPAMRVATYEGKVLDQAPYKFAANSTSGAG